MNSITIKFDKAVQSLGQLIVSSVSVMTEASIAQYQPSDTTVINTNIAEGLLPQQAK